MNYYERHLGDYARDTGHLSLVEHGVYNKLMDRYYATEEGIPAEQIFRISGARTKEEKLATELVVSEFFSLENGIYRHGRIEGEIDKARARIDSARDNGKKGGRPKKNPLGFENESASKPTGLLLGSSGETGSKALQTPDSIHHKDQEHLSSTKVDDPSGKLELTSDPPADLAARKVQRIQQIASEAQEAYNRILGKPNGMLTGCSVLNKPRMKAVDKCLPTARIICQQIYGNERITPQFWIDYFSEAARDNFHSGKGPYKAPHENWRPDFEFLLREEVMAKLFDRAQEQVA